MAFLSGRRLEKCPRREDLLHYWPMLIEGMRFSTKEFYDRIEAALQARSIPELEVSRVDIKEGGPHVASRASICDSAANGSFSISAPCRSAAAFTFQSGSGDSRAAWDSSSSSCCCSHRPWLRDWHYVSDAINVSSAHARILGSP